MKLDKRLYEQKRSILQNITLNVLVAYHNETDLNFHIQKSYSGQRRKIIHYGVYT